MLQELPALTPGQYSLVFNMFSFTVATMTASFVFFVMARKNLAPKYRISMMVSALVVFIAGYHYFRITSSWEAAYALNATAGMYEPTGDLFNDAYRYVDWLLTVPLLTVELVLVMGLPKNERGPLAAKLGFLAAAMIVLGYPVKSVAMPASSARVASGASSAPFPSSGSCTFCLPSLATPFSARAAACPPSWATHACSCWPPGASTPIAYMIPMVYPEAFPTNTPGTIVALQVGYTIADVLAKAGYGVLIYNIAKAKSEEEGFNVDEMAQPATATA